MKELAKRLRALADYLRETKLSVQELEAIQRILGSAKILDEEAEALEKGKKNETGNEQGK